MKVSSQRIEGGQALLQVEVEPEEMEGFLEQAYRRLVHRTAVPGFRKGKAPRPMLERYLGRAALLENAVDHLVPEVYSRALEQEGLEAIAQPKLEVTRLEPVSFTATVPLRPTVELGDYRQLRFEVEPVSVGEEEIAQALEELRHLHAPWEPVDRPVALGDLVTLDLEGTVAGEVVLRKQALAYHVSAEANPPGLAQSLVGLVRNQEKEFSLVLPQGQGRYAGKECLFRALVTEVKEKRLADLDDELARSLEVESLEALKERVAGDIRGRKEREARARLQERVMEALVGLAQMEYPEVLVEREVERLLSERRSRLGDPGRNLDELRTELRPQAADNVVRSLALGRVAELEGIEVAAEEVEAEVERLAQGVGEAGPNLRKALSTPEARRSLENGLLVSKTLDRLGSLATGEGSGAEAETGNRT